MTEKFEMGAKVSLMGVYLLAIVALLMLACHQAMRLLRLEALPALRGLNLGPLGYALLIATMAAGLLALVFRHPRRLLVVSLLAVLAFAGLNLYSGRHILPQVLIPPAPTALAERYARALAADDLEAALQLTDGSDGSARIMTRVFQDHRSQLTGRLDFGWQILGFHDTSAKSAATFYVDHVPQQLVTVMVETESGRTAWLTLRMCYDPFVGTRHICGNNVDPFSQEPGADVGYGSFLLALDPHDNLHTFVLLPALAGLLILGGAGGVWAILAWWRPSPRPGATKGGRPKDRMAWVHYGLYGLLGWLALSLLLILDLAASVSLFFGFTAIYAFCWTLVGLAILHPRPRHEKLLAVSLFALALLSVRSVNWNSRKPFLRDLDSVRLGAPVAQVDELLGDYMKGTSFAAQVDEQGRVISGTISYRHTTEGWGNSDIGVLTVAGGRVVDIKFLPD